MNSLPPERSSFSEENYTNNAIIAPASGVELLGAATEGRGEKVVQILESDPELLLVGDPVGDTALHLLARAGHVEALRHLIRFLKDKHPEVLMAGVDQSNEDGKTPLQLAVENGHKKAALLLFKRDAKAKWNESKDGRKCYWNEVLDTGRYELLVQMYGKYPSNMNVDRDYNRVNKWKECKHICTSFVNFFCNGWSKQRRYLKSGASENGVFSPQDEDELVRSRYTIILDFMVEYNSSVSYCSSTADIEMDLNRNTYKTDIIKLLKADPNLIHLKNRMGNTIIHEVACSGNIDLLTKLVQHLTTNPRKNNIEDRTQLLRPTDLLLEGNMYGHTALHLAIFNGYMEAARYLIEVVPEAACRVNKEGESPLFLALKYGRDELVKCMLQNIPRVGTFQSTRHTLFTKRGSLPHAAIKARNLSILEKILEKFPELINSSDEKGWKPLSYAAYKGYSDEVDHMLSKFPESLKKLDDDGSLPIHKATSGGHINILHKFISFDREALYATDLKGRTVLHIAVRYMKDHILGYLVHEVADIEKISSFKDHDGNTYMDLAKELKRKYN